MSKTWEFPGDLVGAYPGTKVYARKEDSVVYEIPLREDKCIVVFSNDADNGWCACVADPRSVGRTQANVFADRHMPIVNIQTHKNLAHSDTLDIIAFIEEHKVT